MTIINDLEIDNINYINNDIHNGIKNNKVYSFSFHTHTRI